MIEFLRHGFGVFDERHPIGPAEWPHFDFLFVHTGAVRIDFPSCRQTLRLARNEGVLIWPHTRFSGRPETREAKASIQHFNVSPGAPEPFAALHRRRNGFVTQNGADSFMLRKDVERAQTLARHPATERNVHSRRALLALILSEGGFLDARGEGATPVKRIDLPTLERWILANLARHAGIGAIAREHALSPGRFRSVFRKEHGMTAGAFVQAIRDREARRLLAETRASIKAIAHELGYADLVAFHHAFTTRNRLTPARYRRLHSVTG